MKRWRRLKLALPLGLLPVVAACGAVGYDVTKLSRTGSVKDCDVAPIAYRALEQPPVFKLEGIEGSLMVFTWSTEPKDVEVVVSWSVPNKRRPPEQQERWIKDRLSNWRGPLGKLRDDRGKVTRQTLDDSPWTALVKSEKTEEGQRFDVYWAGILPNPDCIVNINTFTDEVVPTSTTWSDFRQKVERLRRALTGTFESSRGPATASE